MFSNSHVANKIESANCVTHHVGINIKTSTIMCFTILFDHLLCIL